MRLLLVRHADAGEREQWQGDDRARPLSPAGFTQARALPDAVAEALDGAGLEQVLSSPFLRCVQSVEPLALAHRLTVERVDALAEGDAREAVELVRTLAGRAAALCTHGDIVPEVLAALAADGLRLPPRPRWAKGSTWVLRADRGHFVRADYVPAPRA